MSGANSVVVITDHSGESGLASLGAEAITGVGFMLASRDGNAGGVRAAKSKVRQRS